MSIFWEIHSGLPQEGPGSNESTRRALGLVPNAAFRRTILDVGCGPGRQTLVLASETAAEICAVDWHRPFLEELNRRAAAVGLDDRITIRPESMDRLPFAGGSFDLIWSEGAIYIMGFERGLRDWRRLLAPEGVVAVTELTWLVDDPPAEARRFWRENYPAMRSLRDNLDVVYQAGYRHLGHFTLPQSDWTHEYLDPLSARISALREKYSDDPAALAELDQEESERSMVERHGDAFAYVFYVMEVASRTRRRL